MAFMTRVAVDTLAVSSSRSECIVSGSRFTVSTLMSSFLRVTSLRPGDTEGQPGHLCQPLQASPVAAPGVCVLGAGEAGALCGLRPLLTAFAAAIEEEHQGDEEEGEQDARPDGGPGDDAHGQHLFRGKERQG